MNNETKIKGKKNIVIQEAKDSTFYINVEKDSADKETQSTQKFYPKNFPQSLIYFTGREKVLENISEALENHGTAAFADTHGVGKSSVVIEFAYRRQETYKHILFIRATNNEFNIYVSEIVKELGFALPEDAKPEQRLAVLQDWLAKNQDWLLLVDNVDDVDFIHDCKFNKPNGKVIYTSNDEKIFKVGTQVKLPKLNDENAMLLLYKHWQDDADAKFEDIPEKAHTTLKGIAEKFGNHPFSMAFVGSYLAEEGESLEEFLKAYQSKEKNLLEKYKILSGYQHENVAAAFLLRFEQISTPKYDTEREQFLSIAVKDYLKLSAFVGTDNIPEELLQQSLAKLHPDQAEWTEDKDFIKDIYKKFKPTSIFKRDAENKTLTTHRIVQEIMRFQIKDEEGLLLETLSQVLDSNFEFFDFINKERVDRYLTHVGTFLEYLESNKSKPNENFKLENEYIAMLCNNGANYFLQYQLYELAEKYFELFKNVCESNKFISEDWLATSYNNLAEVYRRQERYEEAEYFFKKSLTISIKILGENHSDTAINYNNLGKLYYSQKKYEKAEPLFKKSLTIMKKVLEENHPLIAIGYNDLSTLYFNIDDLGLAKEYQQKSLKILLELWNENHPDTAAGYSWLGTFCHKEGKYQEALDYFYKAHEIFSKFFPKEHFNMLNTQNWINECECLIRK